MTRLLLALGVLAALAGPAIAVEPRERLADPVLEGRAREISKGLRCLVCRNESIDESGADLAHDVRMLLRERLTAGASDAQAVQSIVDRYGDFVLLNPPLKPATYVLWFGPPLLLAAASLTLVLASRRRHSADAGPAAATADTINPDALTPAELARLARMMPPDLAQQERDR
jgi:cytochrome c-type biogenesis protein CcmH